MTGADWQEVGAGVLVRRHDSFDLNVGLVVGDGACLVIDTREHLAAGRDLTAAVRRVTAAPWTVVNTHAHFDHFLGNAAFAPSDIWALDRCALTIERYGAVQRRVMSHLARKAGDDAMAIELEGSPVVVPNRVFPAPRTQLDIGGRPVTLHHLGRGHTDNDVVITVDDTSVVFAGDLVEEGAPPAFDDAYPIEWVATLGALLPMLPGPVVPGHGAVVDAGFVAAQRDLLERVTRVARTDAATVDGLPDEVATTALTRARAELTGDLVLPTPEEVLARFGIG